MTLLACIATLLFFVSPALSADEQGTLLSRHRECAATDSKEPVLDVPYIQTELYIVNEMLRLLDLRESDILYDLGCGDGRIVIDAVKRSGARGVGIDIDPRRIAESKANALAAGVADRTVFLRQDLFESDFRNATAIAMFLLPELNLRLRPKLFRDLKPGTRIVSHNFHMGDWKPDKEVSAGLWSDGPHNLYFWIIPVNASGRWQGQRGNESWTLWVTQKYQKIEGSLLVDERNLLSFPETSLDGDKIFFVARSKDHTRSITFEGKISGDTMEGIINEIGAAATVWRATRDPFTATPIE